MDKFMKSNKAALFLVIAIAAIGGLLLFGMNANQPSPTPPAPAPAPTPGKAPTPAPLSDPQATNRVVAKTCESMTPSSIKVVQKTDLVVVNEDSNPHWFFWDAKKPEVGFWIGGKSEGKIGVPVSGVHNLGCDKNTVAVQVTVTEK